MCEYEKIAVVFSENTNNSDDAIEEMNAVINKIAKENDGIVIEWNKRTLLFFKSGRSFESIGCGGVEDKVKDLVSCDAYFVNFSSELAVYENFTDVVKAIGKGLTLKFLEVIGYDVDDFDFKAIACRDFDRFYGDCHG
jgi:hypothetical protein